MDSAPLPHPAQLTAGAPASKIREIAARSLHVELKNAALLRQLVDKVKIESELAQTFAVITVILSDSGLTGRDKKELGENIDSWRERLESVAASQTESTSLQNEVVECEAAEPRTELQRIQERESKARTLTWRIKNDIALGIRLFRTDVFSRLENIFVTVQQTVYISELPIGDKEDLCRQISGIQAKDELITRLLALCKPKELLLPSVWAERYRLAPSDSPKAGRWHNFPFQVQVMDSITDSTVGSLTLMFASQLLGKSSIIETLLLWAIDQAPCNIVCVHPTHANAVAWSKNRFTPLIDSTERVAKLVDQAKPKHRGSGENTTVHKRFRGGWILCGGSGSPNNLLRAHTAKITCFDEVDGYRDSAGSDGDIITLVQQRSIRYPDAFSILTSTPGAKGVSRIEKSLAESDARHWFCRCRYCSEQFVIMFHNIKWEKTIGADGHKVHHTESAYLECPVCKAHLTDRDRADMVEKGEWIATQPGVVGKRGYWANAFLVLGPVKRGYTSWLHFFASEFLAKSKLGVAGLRPFTNLILGESHELHGSESPPWTELFNRRRPFPEHEGQITLDEKIGLICVGVDVQQDRLEVEVIGISETDESWALQYTVIPGNPEMRAVWQQLREVLHRSWIHPSGHRIFPSYCCIDANYLDEYVDKFCRDTCHRHLTVTATVGKRGFQRKWWRRSKTDPLLIILGIDYPKEMIYRRLRISEPGPEYCHYPSNPQCGYEPSYFEGLTSEKMMLDKSIPYFVKKTDRARNEPLDIRLLCLTAKELANPDWPKVKAWLDTPPSEEEDWRPSSERRQALLNKEIPDLRDVVPSPGEIEEGFRAIVNKHPGLKKWCSVT